MKRKRIVLFTDGFPWGKGEKSFLIPEIKYLVEKYELNIVSRAPWEVYKNRESETNLNSGVVVKHYAGDEINKKDKYFGLIYILLDSVCRNELRTVVKEKRGKACLRETYFYYLRARKMAKWLSENQFIQELDNTIFYSYWENTCALSLALLKRKNGNLRFVTRAHGYDLYNHRFVGMRQPFRKIIDAQVDRVIFIAEKGREYYRENFGNNENLYKYIVCKLGVEGPKKYALKKQSSVFKIISCSNVIPLKRIDIIIRALAQIDEIEIEWIHFGNGKEFDSTVELAHDLLGVKKNIQYRFMGHVSNEVVMNYYEDNWVDCFITTSESEGCPVSIQEALASGIPIIGTDVGEIGSMINGNGVLLSSNPTVEEVTEAILNITRVGERENERMRQCSRKIWEKNYQSVINTKHFIEELEQVW